MQPKSQSAKPIAQVERSRGLSRLTAGLTRLPPGLKVKTSIRAGCFGGCNN
jgi:hypothetical protein